MSTGRWIHACAFSFSFFFFPPQHQTTASVTHETASHPSCPRFSQNKNSSKGSWETWQASCETGSVDTRVTGWWESDAIWQSAGLTSEFRWVQITYLLLCTDACNAFQLRDDSSDPGAGRKDDVPRWKTRSFQWHIKTLKGTSGASSVLVRAYGLMTVWKQLIIHPSGSPSAVERGLK